ncbi:EAL domain-containing protein [Massilia sp. YIM B04103]|uniref:EAL domain-containing protein n=1 Tax=Massilia sp. YIM B04103 TaxID=2963106 RepID=UPI00210CCE45|nr:EAL domain-containing protein [Massilia sp. YIM B04103]
MATILIVDDRPSNREYLVTLLGFTPHRLLEACDGVQALALARRAYPDLVITDILMPGMDGFEFVQKLRTDAALATTPVIFYSATYSPDEMQAMASSCGVRTVLPKPCEQQAILDAVALELGLDETTGPAAGAAPASGAPARDAGAPAASAASRPAFLSSQSGTASRLVALQEFSLRLNGERDGAQMAADFARGAAILLDAEVVALCLLNSNESGIGHLAAHGVGADQLHAQATDQERFPGQLMASRHLLHLRAGAAELHALPAGHPPVHEALGLAIRDGLALHGWVYAANPRDRPFSGEDEQTLLLLAAQLAGAYRNMQLYEVVQRHAAHLQVEAAARQASEARYRAMSESAPDAIIALDSGQRILSFNRAAEAMFGYAASEVLGRHAAMLIAPRSQAEHQARFERYRDTGETAYSGRLAELHGRRKNGEEFIGELSLSVASADGAPLFTVILRDTTQRRAMEERLRLFARVFDSTQERITITDAAGRVVAVNPAFTQITGYAESEVLGQNPRLLRSGRQEPGFYREMWHCLETKGHWRGEIWNRRKNGEVYPERMSIDTMRDERDKVAAYVSVSSDISALKQAHYQLDFLHSHDPLTQLPNRALLNDRLQQAIQSAEAGTRQVALLLLDIDRLQRINDSLGHEAGDLLLQRLAQRLSLTAGPADTLAHLGGDEFALLLTQFDDVDEVIAAARRLLAHLAEPLAIHGQEVYVTASIGISLSPRDGATASALLIGAGAALSHMKQTGRNGFRFFTAEMNAHALRWVTLETHLRHAIDRQELELVYQPQVALSDGRVSGMEALLRWNSAELGRVSPADFIPLAEDSGLIHEIGRWVLLQACRQNQLWHGAGLGELPVAVNVSASQLASGRLPDDVRAALAASGLPPQCLELELTESVMMRDFEHTQAQLAELAGLGISISLDDFGTGYSSLSYLSRFTLDKLKIDQSFVRNITSEPRSAAIAQATVALAHGLNLVVVAEGVETAGQLSYLRGIGCDKIQGFLFSAPLAADDFESLLREGRRLLPDTLEDLELTPSRTLLLLDDEPSILYALVRLFRREGYRMLIAHNAHQALELLAANPVQVVISDQRMPEMSGTEFLARARELYPHTVRMVLSGYADLATVTDAINRGAIYKFLSKPWDGEELKQAVRDAFALAEQREALRAD